VIKFEGQKTTYFCDGMKSMCFLFVCCLGTWLGVTVATDKQSIMSAGTTMSGWMWVIYVTFVIEYYSCMKNKQNFLYHPHAKPFETKKVINLKSSIKLNYSCTVGFFTIKLHNKIPLDYIWIKFSFIFLNECWIIFYDIYLCNKLYKYTKNKLK
jgi:hypothetical protein